MGSGEKLVDSLKALWNEAVPSQALNYKDDHIISWFVSDPPGGTCQLHLHVLHAGMEKNWGSRQNEILCLVLTPTVADQLRRAYPDQSYYGPNVKWDNTLPERHKSANPNTQSPSSQRAESDVLPMPFESGSLRPTPGHRVNFVEIWNPGNQLGYGWRCNCERGMLCDSAVVHANMQPYRDIRGAAQADPHFTIAIPIFQQLLHRVGVTYMVAKDWQGEDVQEYSISVPTGLGEQTRFYTAADWEAGLIDPVGEIVRLVTQDMLANTAEGMAIVKLSENYASGRFRSNICTYRKHNIGTNMALQARFKDQSPRTKTLLANAFSLMHYGMCLVCATNEELALMVPSQV
jgi:hypothetical protein